MTMDSLPRSTARHLSASGNDDVIGRAGGGGGVDAGGSRRTSTSERAVFFQQRSTSSGTDAGGRRPTRSDTLQSTASGGGAPAGGQLQQPPRFRAATVATGGRIVVGLPEKESGLLANRSLFIFSEENFVRKYAKIIIEWGYPLIGVTSLYNYIIKVSFCLS